MPSTGLPTLLNLLGYAAISAMTMAPVANAQSDAANVGGATATAGTTSAVTQAAVTTTESKPTGETAKPTGEAEKPSAGTKIVTFDQVRPTFRKHCGACHGEQQQRGDLDLSTKDAVMAGSSSGVVAVPGKPEESLLYVLTAHLDDPKMPPGAPRIPQRELDLIKNWIAHGMRERVEDEVATVAADAPASDASVGDKAVGGKAAGNTASDQAMDEAPAGGMAGPADTEATGSAAKSNKLDGLKSIGKDSAAVVDAGFVGVRPAHHATPVAALATSPVSTLLAMSGNEQVVFAESPAAGFVRAVEFPEGDVFSLRFTADGKTLIAAGGVGGASGRVVGFDVSTGKRLFAVGDETDIVLATDISPDGTLIAVGGPSRKVRVLNIADGQVAATITRHTDWILSLAFSPDGLLLASSDRFGAVYVAEASTGKSFMEFRGHTGAVTQLKWHASGDRLLSAGLDGTLRHWNLHTSSEESRIDTTVGGVLSFAGHPEGRLFVGGRLKKASSVAKEPGSVVSEWKFADEVTAIALSHDEKTLFAAEATGRVFAVPVVDNQSAEGSAAGSTTAGTDGAVTLQLPVKPAERVLAVVSAKLKPAIKLPETKLIATTKAVETPASNKPTAESSSTTTVAVAGPAVASDTALSSTPFGSHSIEDLELSLAAAQQSASISHEEWQSATAAKISAADALKFAQETAASLQKSHDALSAVVSARESAAKRQAKMVTAIVSELQRRKSAPMPSVGGAANMTASGKPAAAEPAAKDAAANNTSDARQAALKKTRELRDQLVAASAAAPNDAALKSAANAAIAMCEQLAKGETTATVDQQRVADADERSDQNPASGN